MNEKISVIVPIYKVENYLPECLDSILEQTYKNFELILVDDGSPDRCPEICEEYAKRDERIKVIHKKNGGLSDARNAGLKIASGDYITFVDSDDYVAPIFLEHLLNAALKSKADVTVCGIYKINKQKEIKTILCPKDFPFFHAKNNNEVLELAHLFRMDLSLGLFLHSVWNKLYTKESIEDLTFDISAYGKEDIVFNYLVYEKISSLRIVNEPLYFYRFNSESITGEVKRGPRYHNLRKILWFKWAYDFYEKVGTDDKKKEDALTEYVKHLTIGIMDCWKLPKSELNEYITKYYEAAKLSQIQKLKMPLKRKLIFTLLKNKRTKTIKFLLVVKSILKRGKDKQ